MKYTAANISTNNAEQDDKTCLPPIPEKRYFAISEAAHLCAVKPHVLRYWEGEFAELKPSKRRGNRRYYQYKDILFIRQIRTLLYDSGFTIEGARLQLSQDSQSIVSETIRNDAVVQKVIADLEAMLIRLKETTC